MAVTNLPSDDASSSSSPKGAQDDAWKRSFVDADFDDDDDVFTPSRRDADDAWREQRRENTARETHATKGIYALDDERGAEKKPTTDGVEGDAEQRTRGGRNRCARRRERIRANS